MAEEKTLAEVEAELELRKRMLESPFAAVGIVTNKPRGRPPKGHTVHNAPVDEDGKSAAAIAHEQRMSEVTKPASDLSAEGMREWGEKEFHKLIPEAIGTIKWDLKYGDSKQRSDAADRVFKATGLAQKDVNNFGKGGSIVINLGAGADGIRLPFLQKANTEPATPIVQTIEAEAVKKKGER